MVRLNDGRFPCSGNNQRTAKCNEAIFEGQVPTVGSFKGSAKS